MDYARKMIDAGVDFFSISVHAHNSELGDYLSQSKNSFEQKKQGIINIKKLGGHFHTNTIIMKPNYKNLPDIARMLIKLGADNMNFPFIHPMGEASKNKKLLVPKIIKTKKYLEDTIKICEKNKMPWSVEGVPYCIVEGHEKNLAENFIPKDFSIFSPSKKQKYQNIDFDVARRKGKAKPDKCKECKYYKKCEGIWWRYLKIMGDEEFEPIK